MPSALKNSTLDELYRRLRDLDYTQVDERMAVMLNAILQLEEQGECRESATEAVLMVGYTTDGISNQEQTRWLSCNVDGAIRGFDLARNPGLSNNTDHGAGEFPLPVRPSVRSTGQSTSKTPLMSRAQQTGEAYPDVSIMKRELERTQRERNKANLDRDQAKLERDQAKLESDQARRELDMLRAEQRNRQGEFETKNLERPSTELPTKTVKAVTQGNSAIEATAKNALEIIYEKAAAEAINKVKQDLEAKEIEQRLKQEIERQKMNEALSCSQTIPEAAEGSTKNGNCNTVKMVTGKPSGITKIGARIMSIITVGGHEVTRNLSEPSDQTIMHIDVYADYLSCISPQTTSRVLRALLTRGGSKSVRVDNRYTEAYGPHEVMLNIDGINIYTKTMITCDEDLIGQIYVGKEELKVRSIGHCAMLEEDAMHIGTDADVTADVLDISGKKTQLRGLLDTGVVLSVIPIETWEQMGFNKDDLIDSRIRLSAANKGALRVLGRTPIIALNLGERNLWMSFLAVENLDESDQFILGRDFIRNFDVAIDLNNAMFRIRNPDRRYAIKPVNLIMANETKAPVFLSRRVRLKANEAAIVSLQMKNYNELSDNKQVCIVPNPNSQSAAVLGRSFSITKSGLCVNVLLNTLDMPITIQRGRKLENALPVKTRYEMAENHKQNEVVDCPNHRDKICILR